MHAVKTFIVEDSPVILDNLVAALHELTPVQVIGSTDNETSAVQWLLEPGNECDLIVVDLFLKSGSGLGVLSAATRAGVAARRIVLSNYASRDIRQRCLALGANRVFDKSSEVDELLAYCTSLGEDEPATSVA
jgi:DNA-binding NarL/FixJ family response regulator